MHLICACIYYMLRTCMRLICACICSLVSSGYSTTGGEGAREEGGYTVEHSGTQFTYFLLAELVQEYEY